MATTAVVHDHIVLLLDDEEFESLPPWLTENFNIVEGGTHAGGSSRNKLIVFKDGTYLELFNWIKSPVEFLDWADKLPGLIDFALTTMPPVTAEQNFDNVQNNLSKITSDSNLGVTYISPAAGARKRGDGTEVRWKNSRPSFETTKATPDQVYFPNRRTDVPFFCHDVTDRTVRVPFDHEEITTHACGAVGVDSIEVLVPESHIDSYLSLYSALLGVEKPKWFMNECHDEGAYYWIGVPHPIDSQPAYVAVYPTRHHTVSYSGKAPNTKNSPQPEDVDLNFLRERGIGIRSLTLRQAQPASSGHAIRSLATDGIGTKIKIRDGVGEANS